MTLAAAWTEGRDGGRLLRGALLAGVAATLAACAGGPRPLSVGTGGEPTPRYAPKGTAKPYQVNGVWYYPKAEPHYDEIGVASWYGQQFHNHYTADGEVFDMHLPSAAHKTLPLPSLVEVTNLSNGRTIVVRVNDRGPFVDDRLIDLSKAAADELGFVATGLTKVRVRYVGQAPAPPSSEPRQYQASNDGPKFRLPKVTPSLPPLKAPPVMLAAVTPPPVASMPVAVAPTPMEAASLPRVGAVQAVAEAPLAPLRDSGPPSYVAQARSAAPASGSLADVDSLLSNAPPAAPEPAPEPVQVAAATAAPGLQVQAGVFASRANADALASRLVGAGSPEVQPIERNGQTLYRVVVRGFSNPAQAAAARTQAMAFGAPDARVVGF